MATATVDITGTKTLPSNREKNESMINSNLGLDSELITEQQNVKNNYYYSAGSFNFIFDKGFKPETLEDSDLTSVPFVPSWHKGIISIHGLIIPVIDIFAFVQTQNIKIDNSTTNKSYLLKLEHKSYNPLVLKLDALPQLVDIQDYRKTNVDTGSPKWLKYYLENESTKLAFIDHKELFNQLINNQ